MTPQPGLGLNLGDETELRGRAVLKSGASATKKLARQCRRACGSEMRMNSGANHDHLRPSHTSHCDLECTSYAACAQIFVWMCVHAAAEMQGAIGRETATLEKSTLLASASLQKVIRLQSAVIVTPSPKRRFAASVRDVRNGGLSGRSAGRATTDGRRQ
jgi:hypothetical protein